MKKIGIVLSLMLLLFGVVCLVSCEEATTTVAEKECSHKYVSSIINEADCVNEGKMKYVCSVCNDSYTKEIAATGNHTYTSKVTTEATCTKKGVKTFTCSVCNDSYTEEMAATGNHTYTSKVTTEATCAKEGVKTFTCKTCDKSYTETIAKASHSWSNATCTSAKKCTECGTTSGSALGHYYVNGKCDRCGQSDPSANPFTVLKKHIMNNGTYSDGEYTYVTDITYSDGYKYTRFVTYDSYDDEMNLMLMIDSSALFGIRIDSPSSSSYMWAFTMEGYSMAGNIYPSSFSSSSTLSYSYTNMTNSSLISSAKKLATTMAKIILQGMAMDYASIGISAYDFGFKYY